MKRIGIVIGFSAVCWSSLTGAVYGWEADLHYGLTKWLAVNAGFSLDHAELIAAGNGPSTAEFAEDGESPTPAYPGILCGLKWSSNVGL